MPRWTPESRQKQREVIMKSKPWEKSTGPKTPEGKKNVAQNSLKHGMRSKEIQELLHFLWLQRRYRHAVMKAHKHKQI